MKNKYLSYVALAAAAFATSCSNDNLVTEESEHPSPAGDAVTLEATIGNDDGTRVGLGRKDGKVQLYWHAGEQISVQSKSREDDPSYDNTKFDIGDDIETGDTRATFTGTVPTGYDVDAYALYPYNEKHKFSDDGVTYYLPDSYEYKTVEGNIFSKTTDGTTSYPSNSTCMPMLGTIADGKIKFQYLGGLLVFRIDKMPAESVTFVVSADQQIAGDFTVSNLAAGNCEISTPTETSNLNEVTFTYSNATKGGVGVFYLPVPTGSYTNLKIKDITNDKTAVYGSLNVSRADVITIPIYQGADGSSYSCDYVVNGHKFIDLCLPSGTLWAETNVGATNAADYGNYYAWGEVETKSTYTCDNYKYGTQSSNLTKYTSGDKKTVLDKEDDAAYMNWGSFCRMPTKDEFDELRNSAYCEWEWTTQTASSSSGYKVTSIKNGNSIFLPASGCAGFEGLSDRGSRGYYWLNTLYSEDADYDYAYCLYFEDGKKDSYGDDRSCGFPVRPVAKKFGSELKDNGSVDNLDMNYFDDEWK